MDPDTRQLIAAHAEACQRWPGVALPFAAFERSVTERGVELKDLLAHAADLYLAIACVERVAGAADAFEAACLRNVPIHCARLKLGPDVLDEVAQLVRIRMLTGDAPKLGLYAGRGPLDAWVRIVSVRTAYNLIADRRPDERRRDERPLEALMDGDGGEELRRIRERYKGAFQAALETALGSLPPREKTLLSMSMLDGLSIDAIGGIYRVHRATIARWLVSIRKTVLADVCRALQVDLRSTASEAHSLMQLLRDDVKVSVRRLLTPDELQR